MNITSYYTYFNYLYFIFSNTKFYQIQIFKFSKFFHYMVNQRMISLSILSTNLIHNEYNYRSKTVIKKQKQEQKKI